MDLTPYSKKLVVPTGFVPPRELRYDDVVARGITRDDVAEDVRGINASLDLIVETRGGIIEPMKTVENPCCSNFL